MVFSSPIFLFVFLPSVIIVNLIASIKKNININNFCLLAFSIAFYAYGSLDFLPILVISIIVNYILSYLIYRSENKIAKKIFLALAVTFSVGLLFIFKYLNLFSRVLFEGKYATNIILPLGISFYTFQVISYIVDVYRGDVKHCKNFINFALFAMLFAQLIAGPIVRYKTIEKELKDRKVTLDGFSDGVMRFMIGFAKKIIFANTLGRVTDTAISWLSFYSLGKILTILVIVCYSIQIYLDFSAYSDMAIGIGKMFGFTFDENFNMPFIAKSITEFWKRWHISLSTFFRDYVYIPLGGSRKGLFRTCINLTIVFALSGFWHGASFNFLFWGFYNAFFIVIERILKTKFKINIPSTLGIVYVFIVWNIGMVFFRLDNIGDIKALYDGFVSGPIFNQYARSLLSLVYNFYFLVVFILSLLYLTPIYTIIYNYLNKLRYGYLVIDLVVFTLFVYAVLEMLTTGYNPFIYFRF